MGTYQQFAYNLGQTVLRSESESHFLAPDWPTVVWTEAERKKGQAWGLKTIESFHTYGTPPIEQYTGPRRT